MITEKEYMALARQKYQELQALKDKTTLRDHEVTCTAIWTDWGNQLLEKPLVSPRQTGVKKNDDHPLWTYPD